MPNANKKLRLFEALELRAEYDARIKTLRDCLPESREGRSRLSLLRTEEGFYRPAPDFDVAKAREELRKLERRRRKLNSAIQQANFERRITFHGDTISLHEALEIRKGLNEQLGELHSQVVKAAYQRVIYKEGRDIVEPSDMSYSEAVKQLEAARRDFRELNREIRKASFDTPVDFQDEE